jgi:hypothetical protein
VENSQPNKPADDQHVSKTSAGEKPLRKRWLMERVVVWLGILLLIGIAFLEGSSRNQYETSFKALQTAINARDEKLRTVGIPVGDVGKHIKGFAFHSDKIEEESTTPVRGEPVITKKRYVRYQWPSLFRHYEVKLGFSNTDKDQVVTVDPVIPGINN